MRFTILFLAAMFGGCACGTPVSMAPPVAAAPCAAPQMVAAPQLVAAPVAVEYRVGATEYAKAGLAVPGNVVICAGNFLRCAMDALWPVPTPSAYAVQAQPIQMAPAAAPCAPAGQWQFVPAAPVSAPCPEPVAAICAEPARCVGGVCR